MRYRKDVDGLRAVAVGSVVLFHAGIPGFSGGFVGVDIFFVISGFLITGLIAEQLDQGSFRFLDFYDRRIRRIFPALLAIYVFCTIAGLIISFPGEFRDFADSLAYSAVFLSNVYFFDSAGYFDAPSHTKPLLHTWSLSVEEQFYVLWPVAMIGLWRFAGDRSRRLMILFAAIALSLAYAEWQIFSDNQPAAFYLLQARAWELLIGAALALSISQIRTAQWLAEALAVAGLALIVFAVAALSESNDFPGLNAAIPCLGAALLILSGHERTTLVSRLISNRPIVFLGLISYSLYLWHWPLFSYAHIILDRRPSIGEACALIGLSLAIAALSWRYIEQPFRRGWRGVPPLRTVRTGAAAFAGVAAIGLAIVWSQGLPQRFDDDVEEIWRSADEDGRGNRCAEVDAVAATVAHCLLGKKAQPRNYDVLLLGDSHAAHFAATLDVLLDRHGISGRLLSRAGCLPFADLKTIVRGEEKARCKPFSGRYREFLKKNTQVQLVVIALRWSVYTNEGAHLEAIKQRVDIAGNSDTAPDNNMGAREDLDLALRTLVAELVNEGRQVLLLGEVPSFPTPPYTCVMRARHNDSDERLCSMPIAEMRRHSDFSNQMLTRIAAESASAHVFLPSDVVCSDLGCPPFLNGVFLYRDEDHLNRAGAEQFAKYLKLPPIPGQKAGVTEPAAEKQSLAGKR